MIVVMSKKGTSAENWKTLFASFQTEKLRALAGPLDRKNTFLCFTYGTGKLEIDLRQKTEEMVCVKDVYPAAQSDWVPV